MPRIVETRKIAPVPPARKESNPQIYPHDGVGAELLQAVVDSNDRIAKAFETMVSSHGRARRITVERGSDGKITGAIVEPI